MLRKRALMGTVGACAAVAAVLAATATPAVRTAAADSPQSCSNPVQIGMLGPFTGPAAIPSSSVRAVLRTPGVRRADPIAILRATTTTGRETIERAVAGPLGVRACVDPTIRPAAGSARPPAVPGR